MSASSLSLISSAFLWANILFLLPAGMLLDHHSVKRVVLCSLSVCIMGTAMIATSAQFEMVCLGRFLTGIGNAFCFLSCVILVSRWFHHQQQGLVMGLMVTLAFVGGMLAHTPFAYLIQMTEWRMALWVDVLLGVGLLIWIYFNLENAPSGWIKTSSKQGASLSQGFVNVLRQPQTYYPGLYTSLLNLPILVLCALWGASYLEVVHQVSSIAATGIVSCLFLGSMVGSPLLGWISDRQGKRKSVMWLGIVGTLISFIPLWIGGTHTVGFLSLIFFSLGFFTSAQVISYPLLAESHRPTEVGEATAIASLIIMGGGAVGQLLFGWLMQYRAGIQVIEYSSVDFQFAMGMFPVAVGLAAFALKMIRETNCQREYTLRT